MNNTDQAGGRDDVADKLIDSLCPLESLLTGYRAHIHCAAILIVAACGLLGHSTVIAVLTRPAVSTSQVVCLAYDTVRCDMKNRQPDTLTTTRSSQSA
jgi:hypothetical protein